MEIQPVVEKKYWLQQSVAALRTQLIEHDFRQWSQPNYILAQCQTVIAFPEIDV